MSTGKEMQQLREQLEQQALQTRQALSQLMLVREQLISETNARIEAQVRWMFFFVESFAHGNDSDFYKIYCVCLFLSRHELNSCCNKTENYWNTWHHWVDTTRTNGLASRQPTLDWHHRWDERHILCSELMQCFFCVPLFCRHRLDRIRSNRFRYANAIIYHFLWK